MPGAGLHVGAGCVPGSLFADEAGAEVGLAPAELVEDVLLGVLIADRVVAIKLRTLVVGCDQRLLARREGRANKCERDDHKTAWERGSAGTRCGGRQRRDAADNQSAHSFKKCTAPAERGGSLEERDLK